MPDWPPNLKSQGYQIFTQPAGTVALVPDSANADSPWSNIKVRQAAEYAIDREAIAKGFGFGINTAAYQWYPQGTMPYVPTLTGRKFDLAKAKQLMTDAGFPNGFKTRIISDGTISSDVVVSMQYYLNAIGIKADLEFPTAAAYNEITFSSWNNALLCTTMRTGANPTQGITFTAPPRVQYKSNKSPDNWTTTYNKIMTTPVRLTKVYSGMVSQHFTTMSRLFPFCMSAIYLRSQADFRTMELEHVQVPLAGLSISPGSENRFPGKIYLQSDIIKVPVERTSGIWRAYKIVRRQF